MNNWKEIWSKRQADKKILQTMDKRKVLKELKRAAGFDITQEGLNEQALLLQYDMTRRNLSQGIHSSIELSSVYEVGCGSGANLFLYEGDGLRCGGVDYSQSMLDIAKEVLRTEDLLCDEAVNMKTDIKYDGVLSNSVFSYFTDLEYAGQVLEKMVEKSNFSIGIMDVHDLDRKEDFISYRKSTIENYEELYRDLPKLFYSRMFFEDFAKKYHLDICFPHFDMPGYWNNDFVFHCFMYMK